MTIIDDITMIAGAAVFLLAIIGTLANPFLRKLRLGHETMENQEGTTSQEPVTILIVTSQGNTEALQRNLPLFLQQDYPEYQVVVVCENTDSETQGLLKRMRGEYQQLYYTFIPNSSRYMSRKKLQITLGTKASRYEWIILTEPSCKPTSNKWLTTMAHHCKEPYHVGIGYVALEQASQGYRRFENILKAYYLLRRAQRTFAYRTHMPSVAFRKSDFLAKNGYQGNLHLERGEYDFLANKYGACGKTFVETRKEAWLVRDKMTDKAWRNEHLYLLASRKFLWRAASMRMLQAIDLLLPHLSVIASLVTLAFAIVTQRWILAGCAGGALLLLLLLRMFIAHRATKFFDNKLLVAMLPLYEYSLAWRNLSRRIRYWRADKNDFTSHKL